MKIIEFERLIKKYKYYKINEINQLKNHLTNPDHYKHNFSPEEISEGYIDNDNYYSTYI